MSGSRCVIVSLQIVTIISRCQTWVAGLVADSPLNWSLVAQRVIRKIGLQCHSPGSSVSRMQSKDYCHVDAGLSARGVCKDISGSPPPVLPMPPPCDHQDSSCLYLLLSCCCLICLIPIIFCYWYQRNTSGKPDDNDSASTSKTLTKPDETVYEVQVPPDFLSSVSTTGNPAKPRDTDYQLPSQVNYPPTISSTRRWYDFNLQKFKTSTEVPDKGKDSQKSSSKEGPTGQRQKASPKKKGKAGRAIPRPV